MDALSILDIGLSGGIVLVTVWFFFLQSPFLFKRLGRAKFVPIMMQMTQLFFDVQVVFGVLLVALAGLRVQGLDANTGTAAAAFVFTAVNRMVIVPKALAKGRASAEERGTNPDSRSATDFAVQGGSKTETKTMHQTVVLFVLLNVGALAAHMLTFLGA